MPTAIETKLAEINSSRIPIIGLPDGSENICPDGVGHYQHYQTGESIYWHPDTGAHLIYGLIKGKWANLGWERSVLGYPNTDESDAGSGHGSRFNNFQHGTIIWKCGPNDAFVVYGPILNKWAAQNWDRGSLGFPLEDEKIEISATGIMRKQNFEGGQITDLLHEGDFIKGALGTAVYKIENNQRRSMPDLDALWSMTTPDKLIILSDYELAGIPIPDINIKPETGNSELIPKNKFLTTKQIKRSPFFENPLIPVGNEPTAEQNKDLLIALDLFSKRKAFDDISALEEFCKSNNNSPWCGSIYLSIGKENFLVGKFSKALSAFAKAWEHLKTATEFDAKQIADRAFGELVSMNARLGRYEELEFLFPQIEERPLIGSTTELVAGAKSGYWLMKNKPEVAFRCGSCAVGSALNTINPHHSFGELFHDAESSLRGMSLKYVFELSKQAGLKYQLARRKPNASIITPCIAHYKLHHYCAITQQNNEMYKIEDNTFGPNFSVWVSKQTIEEEMSGYFLIPTGSLLKGWETVSEEKAKDIWGKGATDTSDHKGTKPMRPKSQR